MKGYRIGEFAAIGGVSAKTLRYYDEVGLLRPAMRDGRSGYRLYTPDQLRELAVILNLRTFGTSIGEIRSLMTKRAIQRFDMRILEQLRSRVEAEIEMSRAKLALLDSAERGLDTGVLSITTKSRSARRVASLRAKLGDYRDAVELEAELLRSVPSGYVTADKGILWHRCADSGSLEAEAFVALSRYERLPGKIYVGDLPAYRTATVYCANANEPAEQGYESVRTWMRIHGHALAGPKFEIEHGSVVEISFPFAVDESAVNCA